MTGFRSAALAAITILVTVASAASFAESYHGLYRWALDHDLHGIWAVAFPAQVDVFIAVGELSLFVALADGWTTRSRTGAWFVTLAGLAVSVAGNVGHVTGDAWTTRGTAAVPPLAAAAALAVGLGVLKRTVARQGAPVPGAAPPVLNGSDPAVQTFAPWLERGQVPGVKTIKAQLGVGQARAQEVRERLRQVAGTR